MPNTEYHEYNNHTNEWIHFTWSDEGILKFYPDDGQSLVNALLRRAQKAEKRILELTLELESYNKNNPPVTMFGKSIMAT